MQLLIQSKSNTTLLVSGSFIDPEDRSTWDRYGTCYELQHRAFSLYGAWLACYKTLRHSSPVACLCFAQLNGVFNNDCINIEHRA